MILIISDSNDSHADSVEEALRIRGASFFRLNLDRESLDDTDVTYNTTFWRVRQFDKIVDSRDIKAVWPRRLSVYIDLDQDNTQQSPEFKLWKSEWNRSLFGFYSCLRDIFWLNRIDKATLIDNKIYQFSLAASCGFSIPEYLYSNNKIDLIKFADKHGSVALKFMSQDLYKMRDGLYMGIYVNKITSRELNAFKDRGENPIFLQSYIEKSFEVRHTYVDGRHFACKIESQRSDRASIDWRRYDLPNTPHSAIMTPKPIQKIITKFMKAAGLDYGAFDFIVDNTGCWWYLEVNSAGQWLWIEDLSGLQISESVADCLVAHMKKG